MAIEKEHDSSGHPSRVRRLGRVVAGSVSAALLWPRLQLARKRPLRPVLRFISPRSCPDRQQTTPITPPGALVAMYENVSGSMRQGVQALVGLAIGIGLAFMLFSLGIPSR